MYSPNFGEEKPDDFPQVYIASYGKLKLDSVTVNHGPAPLSLGHTVYSYISVNGFK